MAPVDQRVPFFHETECEIFFRSSEIDSSSSNNGFDDRDILWAQICVGVPSLSWKVPNNVANDSKCIGAQHQ